MTRRWGRRWDAGERWLSGAIRQRLDINRAIADQLISVVSLLGRPVLNNVGTRVGRVSDVVVRWTGDASYPRVAGLLIGVGKGLAFIEAAEVTLSQTGARLRSDRLLVARPVRRVGDVALARDVLDHQLVDLTGVQVVRAADLYLVDRPGGWELAAVDVGVLALIRRLGPKRRRCPPPARAVSWSDLQSFVPRDPDASSRTAPGLAEAAGEIGNAVRLGVPAGEIKRFRAKEVARILAELGRHEQAQVTSMVAPSAAAAALRELNPSQRSALLAELSEADRERLLTLLQQDQGR